MRCAVSPNSLSPQPEYNRAHARAPPILGDFPAGANPLRLVRRRAAIARRHRRQWLGNAAEKGFNPPRECAVSCRAEKMSPGQHSAPKSLAWQSDDHRIRDIVQGVLHIIHACASLATPLLSPAPPYSWTTPPCSRSVRPVSRPAVFPPPPTAGCRRRMSSSTRWMSFSVAGREPLSCASDGADRATKTAAAKRRG